MCDAKALSVGWQQKSVLAEVASTPKQLES
jgi:hypothetical protein